MAKFEQHSVYATVNQCRLHIFLIKMVTIYILGSDSLTCICEKKMYWVLVDEVRELEFYLKVLTM